jgi:hypothetical protein
MTCILLGAVGAIAAAVLLAVGFVVAVVIVEGDREQL